MFSDATREESKAEPQNESVHRSDFFPNSSVLCDDMSSVLNRSTQWGGIEAKFVDARPLLPIVSFFMGDIRDGITMLNMQSTYLMSTKHFTEKQNGVLFLVFGLSQCITMVPAGYLLDYSSSKIKLVCYSMAVITTLTIATNILAKPEGENMTLMIIIKFLQGAGTAVIPPGFNGIVLGIVGSTGFTHQVSRNKMANHIGTASLVFVATIVAYFLYPNIGLLFFASPLATFGAIYALMKIKPTDVDTDAASCLIIQSPTMTEYETIDEQNEVAEVMAMADTVEHGGVIFDEYSSDDEGHSDYIPPDIDEHHDDPDVTERQDNVTVNNMDSYVGCQVFDNFSPENVKSTWKEFKRRQAQTPLAVFMDKNLLVFSIIVFFFNLSNTAILPLVMQSLALDDEQSGILMSGLCIMIGQTLMMPCAKFAGDYSPLWGRKQIFLSGFFALTARCGILFVIVTLREQIEERVGTDIYHIILLATQILDAIGAGLFGTLYVLVSNDLSGGTGRFSLIIGITSSAMCLGSTVSGYLGQVLAEEQGYNMAFLYLGLISLIPLLMYIFIMPETLPDYARAHKKKRRKLITIFLEMNKRRKAILDRNVNRLSNRLRTKTKRKTLGSDGTGSTQSTKTPPSPLRTSHNNGSAQDSFAPYVNMLT